MKVEAGKGSVILLDVQLRLRGRRESIGFRSYRFVSAPAFIVDALQILLGKIGRINTFPCFTLLQGELLCNDFAFPGIKVKVILGGS